MKWPKAAMWGGVIGIALACAALVLFLGANLVPHSESPPPAPIAAVSPGISAVSIPGQAVPDSSCFRLLDLDLPPSHLSAVVSAGSVTVLVSLTVPLDTIVISLGVVNVGALPLAPHGRDQCVAPPGHANATLSATRVRLSPGAAALPDSLGGSGNFSLTVLPPSATGPAAEAIIWEVVAVEYNATSGQHITVKSPASYMIVSPVA